MCYIRLSTYKTDLGINVYHSKISTEDMHAPMKHVHAF